MLQKTKTVNSRTYRLVSPGKVEEEIIERSIREGDVVVEPTIASICHADLRYYLGDRRPDALANKLPMALIHEGIGKVTISNASDLQVGQRVVVTPNVPGYLIDKGESKECCSNSGKEFIDNYSEKNEFLGSGYDGIAQNFLVLPSICVIPIPEEVPDEIAVLAELCTVTYQAVNRVKSILNDSNSTVAIFGDGPVGYLTAALIHHIYGLDASRLMVFGAIPEKLSHFKFAKCALVQEYDFNTSKKVDIVIECTGGKYSEKAINQGIDIIARGGTLILMGVSEDRVPINTRDVLEKGLTLIGSSRSSYHDFKKVLSAMKDVEYQNTLRSILPNEFTLIENSSDFKSAMDTSAEHRGWHKIILNFKW